jgi:hypothetical protein
MEIVLQFSCLPNSDKVDLNGSGGGFLKLSDNEVLFATGTPSGIETDIEINQYAQRNSSLWGKILKLSLEKDKIKVKMYTKGHRNPQGINQIGKRIFAVEHGPMGGDEINEIKEGMNYGWPIQSLGSHYDSKYINKSYSSPYATQHSLLAFLPSIGISYINECPQVYSKYFSPNECLAVSSMREKAIFLVIFKNESILFYEKIQLNSRIRKFFVQDNTIIAVTDFNGIIVGNLNSLSI